jgi:cytochrome d ubiquinol oxidase subunit II
LSDSWPERLPPRHVPIHQHQSIGSWESALAISRTALAAHGALYLAVKTEADLHERSRTVARRLSVLLLVLTIVSLLASTIARGDTLTNYKQYPIAFLVPAAVLLALVGMIQFSRKREDRKAFACSCAYLTVMLVGAAIAPVRACCHPPPAPNTTSLSRRRFLDHTRYTSD